MRMLEVPVLVPGKRSSSFQWSNGAKLAAESHFCRCRRRARLEEFNHKNEIETIDCRSVSVLQANCRPLGTFIFLRRVRPASLQLPLLRVFLAFASRSAFLPDKLGENHVKI